MSNRPKRSSSSHSTGLEPPRPDVGRRTVSGIHFLSIVTVVVTMAGLLGATWAYQTYRRFQQDVARQTQEYVDAQRTAIRAEVEKALETAALLRSESLRRARESLQSRVAEARAVAENLHSRYAGVLDPRALTALIVEALRPVRFHDGRGYYFLLTLDGTVRLNPLSPELEGRSIADLRDADGVPLWDAIADGAPHADGEFYEYRWLRPGQIGPGSPKVAFVQRFEPLGLLLGTGDYPEDVEAATRAEALARIGAVRFGADGYVFVFDYEGNCLAHVNAEFVGTNLRDYRDPEGRPVIRGLIRTAQGPDGGFLHYVWNKPSVSRQVPKLAYASAFPPWGWVVGAGVYMDDLHQALAGHREALQRELTLQLLSILGLLVLAMPLAFLLAAGVARRLQRELGVFVRFFQSAAARHEEVDPGALSIVELGWLAESANQMVADLCQADDELRRVHDELESRVRERTTRLAESNRKLVREVTDRRRAEEALRLSEQRLRAVVHNLPEGVVLLDGAHRVLVANAVARDLLFSLTGASLGATVEHLAGEPLAQALGEMGRTVELRPPGSPRRVFEASASPVLDEGGERGLVLVVREVTREREVQDTLRRQERLAAVGQLAAGIAHDFNNLLQSVIMCAEMIQRRHEVSDGVGQRAQAIVDQAQRGAHLIRQILDFSRSSASRREPLALRPFLKEVVDMLRHTIPETVRIRVELPGPVPWVEADPSQLQQLVTNLALNARDAMPEGGDLEVRVGTVQVDPAGDVPVPGMGPGEWVCLEVRDTGAGIAPEIQPHIFEPFFSTKGVGKGTGLGLAQVYGIVAEHGGHIGVASTVGEGSSFRVYLPVPESRRPPKRLPMPSRDRGEGHGETVLLVEDDTQVRAATRQGLEALGYRVLEASTGTEGFEAWCRHRGEVALVLTDLTMPELGGLDLLRRLKAQDPGIKVVVMSGYPLGDDAEALRAEGVAGILAKPFSTGDLAGILEESLAA